MTCAVRKGWERAPAGAKTPQARSAEEFGADSPVRRPRAADAPKKGAMARLAVSCIFDAISAGIYI